MRFARRLAGMVAGVSLMGAIATPAPAPAAIDVFAGSCFVTLSVTWQPTGTSIDLDTVPGSVCTTNEGTGSMSLVGTLPEVGQYGCVWGAASGSADFSVTAAFDSLSAPDADVSLANVAGGVAVTVALHDGTDAEHVVASGVLTENTTLVEECLGNKFTVTMSGAIAFETPTDLTCC